MSNEPAVGRARGHASLDLGDLLRIAWRDRRRILIVGLASAVLAAGISLTMRPVFTSSTQLASASGGGEVAGLAGLVGQIAGAGAIPGLDSLLQSSGKLSLDETLAVASSRDFTLRLIRDVHAEPVLFAERWNAEQVRWKTSSERGVLARIADSIGAATRAVTGDKVVPDPSAAAGGPSDWDLFEKFDASRTFLRDRKTSLVTLSIRG